MLSRISFVCASAVVATVLSVPSFARGKTNTAHTATVTGCLAQGDEPNEYAIKTENGKIYGLSSSTVDLVKHMNHRVTVTGAVTANNEKNNTTSIGQSERTTKPKEESNTQESEYDKACQKDALFQRLLRLTAFRQAPVDKTNNVAAMGTV